MSLKDLLKDLKSDKILIPKVDQFLLSKNTSGTGDGWIHPSGLSRCIRSQVMNVLKYPRTDNLGAQLRRIFSCGDSMHTRFQQWLYKMDLLELCPVCEHKKGWRKCESCRGSGVEQGFEKPKLHIRGHCDGVFKAGAITKDRIILELKSINTNSFSGLQGPDHGYLWQGNVYMEFFGIPKQIFLYEDKNNQSLKEFIMEKEPEIIAKALERVKEINVWVKKGELPPGDCPVGDCDTDCAYCVACEKAQRGKK